MMRWRRSHFLFHCSSRCDIALLCRNSSLIPRASSLHRMSSRLPLLSPTLSSSSSSDRHHQRLRIITSSFTSSSSLSPPPRLPPPAMTSSPSSSLTSLPIDDSSHYPFGPHHLPGSQLFFLTPLSYASVNLAPVVPGHALICPRRAVKRMAEMTVEEVTDVWTLAQAVGVMLTRHLEAPALTFAVQDGKEAGQSVPHVSVAPPSLTLIRSASLCVHSNAPFAGSAFSLSSP